MIVSIWGNIWRLSPGKEITSSLTFSLRYCKDIVNLLFWVLWAYLLRTPKVLLSTYRKLLCLSAGKEINLISHAFLEILQISKLLTLGTLGISGYKPPKRQYSLIENFDVYLHAKNKLHHSLPSWDITFWKILQFDWLTVFELLNCVSV